MFKIKKEKCDLQNKNVTLTFEYSKPKGSDDTCNRLINFKCNNGDNCEYFKERKCKFVK